jgi:hypothetical protein
VLITLAPPIFPWIEVFMYYGMFFCARCEYIRNAILEANNCQHECNSVYHLPISGR